MNLQRIIDLSVVCLSYRTTRTNSIPKKVEVSQRKSEFDGFQINKSHFLDDNTEKEISEVENEKCVL